MPYLLRRQRFYLSLIGFLIGSFTSCISQTADAQVFWEQLIAEARGFTGNAQFQEVKALESRVDSFLKENDLQDSIAYCGFLQILGNSYYNRSQYIPALRIFNQGLRMAPQDEAGRNLYGSMLYDRAFVEYEMRDYKTSYESVVQSELVLSQLQEPDYDYLLAVYNDLAFQATDLGYWEEGEKYLLKGFELLDKFENDVVYLYKDQSQKRVTFNYTALNLYSTMGEEAKLLARFKDFQQYKSRHSLNSGEQYMYAVGLNHIADFYLNFKDRWDSDYPYRQAERFLKASFEELDSARYPANYAQFLFNQNKCYRKMGKYDLALEGNEKLLALVDSTDGRMPFFLAQKSLIYGASQQPEESLAAFEDMLNLIHQGSAPLNEQFANFEPSPVINHSSLIAGVMESILNSLPEHEAVMHMASQAFPLAMEQFEHTYLYQYMNPKLAEFYTKTIGGILHYCPLEGENAAFSLAQLIEQMEQIENRLAWQVHLQNRNAEVLGLPDSLLQQELYLRNRIAQAKVAGASPEEVFEWEDQLNKLERKTQVAYPEHMRFVSAPFDMQAFQTQLKNGDVVLKYHEAADQLFLFSIRKDEIQLMNLGEKKAIYDSTDKLLAAIDQAAQLPTTDSLLRQLLPFSLASARHLYILPTANLYAFPFGVLQTANRYLIGDHSISYASHLVFLSSQLISIKMSNTN